MKAAVVPRCSRGRFQSIKQAGSTHEKSCKHTACHVECFHRSFGVVLSRKKKCSRAGAHVPVCAPGWKQQQQQQPPPGPERNNSAIEL